MLTIGAITSTVSPSPTSHEKKKAENAAKTAKKAYKDNISLKEACVELGFLTSEKFDEVFHPEEMV